MAKRNQVTISVDPELRQFLEAKAQAEDRSLAGQIRHVLAEAARRAPTHEEHAA